MNTIPIYLTDSQTRSKKLFEPISHGTVKIYTCGPTVYDRAHLGNARSAVTYDILFRFLKRIYPSVVYVRNITDIDDKIINKCLADGIQAIDLTTTMTNYYHEDMHALNCLPPTHEPRASQYIPQMIAMIQKLIAKGHAYEANSHVLFSVDSYEKYGQLSNRTQDEMIAGSRVEVAPYKKHPADFILWKPSPAAEKAFGFDSPWGWGRPGWHIECSAMTKGLLGEVFDIHGGGVDLIFPHHENEVAQSKCSSDSHQFANYWVHNGFLMVAGEKMSKSLGNFKTVKDILDNNVEGCVIRCFYLTTHYKKPIDFNDKAISDAKKTIQRFREALVGYQALADKPKADDEFLDCLADDMNTPLYLAKLHEYAIKFLKTGDVKYQQILADGCELIGLDLAKEVEAIPAILHDMAQKRTEAKKVKDWSLADSIRAQIEQEGYIINDTVSGYELVRKD